MGGCKVVYNCNKNNNNLKFINKMLLFFLEFLELDNKRLKDTL